MIRLIVLIIFVTTYSVFSQDDLLKVLTSINKSKLVIGDQFNYTISCSYTKDAEFQFPKFEGFGKLEIVSKSKLDTIKYANSYELRQTFILSAYEDGKFIIPELLIPFKKKNISDEYIARADSISVEYSTLNVDTTQDIKDIKPPIGLEFSILDYWYYFVGLLVLILAILLIIRYIRTKKSKVFSEDETFQKVPAYTIAYQTLRKIEKQELYQNGQIKKFYIDTTQVIRIYIEKTSTIKAVEMTTNEIVALMIELNYDNELIDLFRLVFSNADLVKFAKFTPDSNACSNSLKDCFTLLSMLKKYDRSIISRDND